MWGWSGASAAEAYVPQLLLSFLLFPLFSLRAGILAGSM